MSIKIYFLLFLLFVLVGCATTESVWQKAQQVNTVYAYQDFLRKYPKSEFTPEANRRIEKLTWEASEKSNTVKSYQDFLRQYPQGEFTLEANRRIEKLNWEAAQRNNTIQAYQDFIRKYPQNQYVAEANRRIEKLTWEAAQRSNTMNAYQEFLRKYPQSEFAAEADAMIQKFQRVEASMVTAESWPGNLPLKALAPFGNVKNMMTLVRAPNVPNNVLSGKTEFNERSVGMVLLPSNYVNVVVKITISVQSKIVLKASELTLVDVQKNAYHGTLWDDGLRAWVCSDAEYDPGQYEEYVIFILPLSAMAGDKELWLKDQKLASITSVSKRLDTPQINAKAFAGRIIKQSPFGDNVIMQDGKLRDAGSFMTLSGKRMTIVEPKRD